MNPLTAIYASGTALRNAMFDRGLLPVSRLAKPAVSIGNLSAGGTGKTPFVIALGELLRARGVNFDVLSRGYRRKSRGVRIVDPEGTAAEFGDEPLLIARRLGVPVIVGERRYDAGKFAEQQFETHLHILDDGFQHRALARDFDLVLLSASDLHERLLPSGRLREPLSSLGRADAVVLPDDADSGHPALRGKVIWRMRREIVVPAVSAPVIAFCGIARPQQFFAQLHAAGITPAAEIAYRDHHAYMQRDVERLLQARNERDAAGFLTTEKDLINLGDLQSQLQPIAAVALKLALDRPADIVDTILARITERKPRS